MPRVIKKRPARKRPVQEDEVKSTVLQAVETLKMRQRQIIVGASVVLAVVLVFIITSLYSALQYKKAKSLEVQASGYYQGKTSDPDMTEQDRLKRAIELYRKSVDTKATPSALFYLGNAYYRAGDFSNAIKTYERFILKFSSEKEILPLVYQKLASAYFKAEQKDKALHTLNTLSEFDGGIFRDTALMIEARHYENSGQKQKAMDIYARISSEFPESPWSADASAKIKAEKTAEEKISEDNKGDEQKNKPSASDAAKSAQ